MKILAIDTSATAASVAVVDDEALVGEFFINTKITHSQTLVPMIDELCKNISMPLNDIDAIAVNAGPGSFTGVRIGVAAAKGLAFPDNKKCVSVSTLESMAYNLLGNDCIVCAVMDARCAQVYNALFKITDSGVERICDDRALSISELSEELKQYNEKIILVGDGAKICYDAFKDVLSNVHIAPINNRFQRAASTAMAALKYVELNNTMSCAELMPIYLRLPQAQRELNKKRELAEKQ
ncbi:MAG: tRNA (adenosine(37)-N6)-threonylcarbamoyltransferase complex dimerization subunit type 1 TsaB [Ruminococcus sp.]|nr:tRNA (adenosine(37)-N6)-threonylcarbamoyltransferase complex dimerization subunit type 1 TsaB [Ruminococcus sp.]